MGRWRTCRAAVVPTLMLASTACFASKSDIDELRNELNTLRAETSSADSARAMQMVQMLGTLRSVADSLDQVSARVTRVRAETQSGIRDIHNQVRQVEEASGQSQQRIQEMRAQLEQRNRVTPPAPAPTDTVAVIPGQPQAAPDGPGPNELFQMGRDQLARGGNTAARAAFSDLLARYPQSELAADAQFFLAEALAAEGKTAAADTAYATVVTKYPESLRAATALYKRGVAQQKAGKTTTAKRTFNDVIRRFPESDEAALARERLRTMK
jgi:tol-pal system protein YbgF